MSILPISARLRSGPSLMCEPRNGSNGCGMLTSPPCRWISSAVSLALRPRGMVFSRKTPTTSPSAVLTSSPRMTVSLSVRPSSATLSRTATAPSTLLWFVTQTCVRPRSTAFSMNFCSVRIESRLKRVWMWKSAKTRFVGCFPVASRSLPSAARSSLAEAAMVTLAASPLLDQALAVQVELLERHAGPDRHGVERVLGDVARDAGYLGQQLVEVSQQRSAARHDHSLVDDVAGQLGWGLLKHISDRGDDRLQRLLDGLGDLR